MNVATVRDAYRKVTAEAGSGVTVVAATKYVSLEDMSVLAEAGVRVVGENRVQDLLAKQAAYGDAFRWHFIGRLQSNKARAVGEVCELVHAVDTDTAARRLIVPWLLEVNLSNEPTKGGVDPADIEEWLSRYPMVRGLMTMPPFTDEPEDSRVAFRQLAALAAEHGLPELSMGTSQDWRVAVQEGATYVRVGSALWQPSSPAGATISPHGLR